MNDKRDLKDMKDIVLQSMDMNKWDGLLTSPLPEGVDAAEVFASEGDSFSVGLLDGEIDTYELSQSSSVYLRADCGQIGYAYSEAPDQDPSELLTDAVESASSVNSEDAPYQRFYSGGENYVSLPAVDERLLAMGAAEKIEWVHELERRMLAADERIVRLEDCMLSTGASRSAIRNSLGLRVASESGYAMAYCSPVAEADGEIKNGMGYHIARCVEELDMDRIVAEAREDVLSQLGAGTVPSGSYSTVWKHTAVISMLGVFASIFSADAAQKGLSLLAGKEGETIASAVVNIVDDSLHPLSLFQQNYDAEGVPGQRSQVIENGVLKTLLHNRKAAQKAGVDTTGNAVHGASLGVGPSNFILEGGTHSLEDLFAHMGDGLYITDVSGLHAGANPVSGSFSLLARGFVVENGAKTRPVDQITVSGNIFDWLKQVKAVGDDLRFGMGSIAAPAMWVEQIQVAGS